MDAFFRTLEGRRPDNMDNLRLCLELKNNYLLAQAGKRNALYAGDKLQWAYFYGIEQATRASLEFLYGIQPVNRDAEVLQNINDVREF